MPSWQAHLPVGRMGKVGLLGTAGWSMASIQLSLGIGLLAIDQPSRPEQQSKAFQALTPYILAPDYPASGWRALTIWLLHVLQAFYQHCPAGLYTPWKPKLDPGPTSLWSGEPS